MKENLLCWTSWKNYYQIIHHVKFCSVGSLLTLCSLKKLLGCLSYGDSSRLTYFNRDYITMAVLHALILQQPLYSQLKYNTHGLPIVIGIIQLNETWMLQQTHNFNFTLHIATVFTFWSRYKFGCQLQTTTLLSTPINRPKLASETMQTSCIITEF